MLTTECNEYFEYTERKTKPLRCAENETAQNLLASGQFIRGVARCAVIYSVSILQ